MLKYQHLLYSRSLSKDYRWMIVPQGSSADDLKKLRELYDRYDIHKGKKAFHEADIDSIYCLQLSSITVLIRCCLSDYKDEYGREIYCLQGISISPAYKRHFWFALPWLLANHMASLNTWQKVNFQIADELRSTASNDYELDLNFNKLPLSDSSNIVPDNTLPDDQILLSFNSDGFKQLLRFISSPHTPLVDFAFGTTPEMTQISNSFKIVASAQSRTGLQAIGDGILSILSWNKRTT